MSKQELKPCPFCGGVPKITKHFKYDDFRMVHRCKVLGPITIDWSSKEYIAETWNTRKLTPMQKAAPDMFEALEKIEEITSKYYFDEINRHEYEYIEEYAKEALKKARAE